MSQKVGGSAHIGVNSSLEKALGQHPFALLMEYMNLESTTLDGLDAQVADAINDGWEPVGSMTISTGEFCAILTFRQ